MLVLFGLSLVALLLAVGLVVDAGYAYGQRRAAQNAADFAAMAGTRIVAESLQGDATNGTPSNVMNAITSVLTANNAQLVSAQYVSAAGVLKGNVTTVAPIPNGAYGVVVTANRSWRPFFLGVIGVSSWSAGAGATAITPPTTASGTVLPVGVQDTQYTNLLLHNCNIDQLSTCKLTSGGLNLPGGFGWLKFGCPNSGLGQGSNGGCANSQPFLQSEVGPPANSYGCCTAVGQPGSPDQIGNGPGNKPADLSYYINNQIPVWVPIWSGLPGGQGQNGFYHIVGYGAIVFVGQGTQHGKGLTGSPVTDKNGNVICSGTGNSQVPGKNYCTAPGNAFSTVVSGDIRLLH
jgi:Flp pilus assembly protein TadG